jgi:hypothetical protein
MTANLSDTLPFFLKCSAGFHANHFFGVRRLAGAWQLRPITKMNEERESQK